MEIYYTFSNTHAVIFAEKILLSAAFPVKVRPVPGSISAGCGMCLSIPAKLRKSIEDEFTKHAIAFSAAYLHQDGQYILLE